MNLIDYIGESTFYDKKLMLERKEPLSWLKSVSAFANTSGGKLLLGVRDDGELVGLSNAEKDAEDLSEILKNQMDPVPPFDLSFHAQKGKRFLIVDVQAGGETPYYTLVKGHRDAFVRIGNESVKANSIQLKRLVLKGEKRTWDSLSSRYRRENYAVEVLRATYYKQTKLAFTEKDMMSFNLVDGDGMLTNAGALLVDGSPIYQSRVFCTRWNGLTKTNGLMEAYDDDEFSGGLISLLNSTKDFVKRNTKSMWRKTSDGRKNYPEYPEVAIGEGIVNGLIHRDYLELGSEVHVDIFDDRMEIYSPGGMPSGELVQNLDARNVSSKRRNPLIADFFQRLDLMERRGSGFGKILDAYKFESEKRGINVRPAFRSTASEFHVILPNLNYGWRLNVGSGSFSNVTTETTTETTIETTTERLAGKIGKVTAKVYLFLKADNKISAAEIGKRIGLTTDGVRFHLKKLKAAKVIQFVGNRKSGHWEVACL